MSTDTASGPLTVLVCTPASEGCQGALQGSREAVGYSIQPLLIGVIAADLSSGALTNAEVVHSCAGRRRSTSFFCSSNSLGNGLGMVNILPVAILVVTDQMSPIRATVPAFGVSHPGRGRAG